MDPPRRASHGGSFVTTVSILIPHFNDPAGLALSLKSVAGQTWKGNRTVFVCDDGSTPENVDKLEEHIAASSEQVVLIKNSVNRGRPFTRNVLLDAACGKYTTWLDSGDEYYPTKLAWQIEGLYAARAQGIEGPVWCTCHSHWLWDGATEKKLVVQHVGRSQDVARSQASNLLLGTLRAYLYTLLGTTESFKNAGYFDLNLPRLQDLDFWLQFVSRGGRLVLPPTEEPLCIYYKTDVGRKGDEVLRCNQYILRKHAGLLASHSRTYRRNRRFQQYQLAARFAANNGDKLLVARYLGAAALQNPGRFVRWYAKTGGKL